jgi:hypothetical protein
LLAETELNLSSLGPRFERSGTHAFRK